MTRLVLREIARWMRAVGSRFAVLVAIVVTPSLVPDAAFEALHLVPARVLAIAWMAAVITALTRLTAAGIRAALQPARDERAAVHLQELRDRSVLSHHRLVCVLEVLWTSRAGERVAVVDARTGEIREVWFAECATQPGAFILLVSADSRWILLDHLEPANTRAAHRHEQVIQARRRAIAARANRLEARAFRRQFGEVLRAAQGFR